MFKDIIGRTPIFTDTFRKSIIGKKFDQLNNDDSLFIAMTVLLGKRVKDIKIESFIYHCLSETCLADAPWVTSNVKNLYIFNWFETGFLNGLDIAKNHMSDGKELIAVENFVFSEIHKKVKVFIYPEYNTVNICLERFSMELYHYMISFMPLYFKILKEQPLSKQETDFMRTFTLKSSVNFQKYLGEMISSKDFTAFMLKSQLTGFEKRMYEIKEKSAETKVNEYENKLETFLRQYQETYSLLVEAQFRLEGIRAVMDGVEEKTELEEYLINNKNLVNITVNGDKISFIVKTYLYPYLAHDWKTLDQRGGIYLCVNEHDREDARLLLSAIFSEEQKLKLKMCAIFEINYFGGTVSSIKYYDYPKANSTLKDYVPNTHLNRYNCFGQNMSDITTQIKDGDLVGAVECCINVAKRINIHERMTFEPFVSNLMKFTGRCLENKDGISMTPKEAIQYLKGLKNEDKQS